MQIELEPLTILNIPEVVAYGKDNYSPFFHLPRTMNEAVSYLAGIEMNRKRQIGDELVAYDVSDGGRTFVGGGQFYREPVSSKEKDCVLGYWVVKALRLQGYGKAILSAVEQQVVERYPDVETTTAYIDHRNVGSVALAASMGYEEDKHTSLKGVLVYRKTLNR